MTVIRVTTGKTKPIAAELEKRLAAFLTTPVDGKLPEIRFFAQSEYNPERDSMMANDPHITATILWE